MSQRTDDKKEPTPKTDDVIRSMGGDLSDREQHIADWARCLERAAPSTERAKVDFASAAHIAEAPDTTLPPKADTSSRATWRADETN